MTKLRGFEEVVEQHRAHGKTVEAHGQSILLHPTTILPTRGDAGSAGYDFYAPVDIMVNPGETHTLWTNVKAYMQPDEMLALYPRSSWGIKRGLRLANTVGVIDASYYSNPDNDGNIGLALHNTTGKGMVIKKGERIVQGIFTKFLVADVDVTLKDERTGGIGSTDK